MTLGVAVGQSAYLHMGLQDTVFKAHTTHDFCERHIHDGHDTLDILPANADRWLNLNHVFVGTLNGKG